MRYVYFGNNDLAVELLEWLEPPVGLVVNSVVKAKRRDELVRVSGLPMEQVFLAEELDAEKLKALEPDIGVSVLFGHILKQDVIDVFPKGIINLHPAYLPYNRGAHPNVWCIMDGTPAGATLHYIDAGIDTGKIICRVKLEVEPWDTAKTIYDKSMLECSRMFKWVWQNLDDIEGISQEPTPTYHKSKDLSELDEIDLDKTYTGRELINQLRARTFPPYRGCTFETPDGTVEITVNLKPL